LAALFYYSPFGGVVGGPIARKQPRLASAAQCHQLGRDPRDLAF